ncbi:hypothetical protein PLCT2_00338 [Planctomycetaceae bacterium]|nr:hypothetical protein PLCT2_00338 [Planctomycetaceae bacterium]
MGKRILIAGLIALLLVAAVSAWLVLDPPGQRNGGEAILPALSNVEGGVSGGTPESTATAHGQDGHATSVQPGSRAGSKDDAVVRGGGKAPRNAGTQPQPEQPSSNPGSVNGPTEPPPNLPAPGVPAPIPQQRARIIDAERPPNQTLGNAKPRSRALATGPAKKLEVVSEKLKQDRRGLYAQYFAFQSDPLAELSKPEAKPLAERDAALVRIDNQVYFPNNEAFADLPVDQRNFAATWDGYLVIPEQGEYWLFLGADNAARLDLDGETVLLNDVQSRYIEVSTVLELAPGLHTLRLEFAQGMLANDDSWRCACNLMYVPKGQQKPEPVPQEMLMVPDWMWTDDAPIITKLSKYEGEIGDEITIQGQGLAENMDPDTPPGSPTLDKIFGPMVVFNGQKAEVLIRSRTELKVRIPIGAITGKVVVIRTRYSFFDPKTGNGSGPPTSVEVPSNSVDFKVTTQFGLMAQWYNLQTGPPRFAQPGADVPQVQRIEPQARIESREQLSAEFRTSSFSCRWEGRFGVPPSQHARELHFWASGALRVTFDELVFEEQAAEAIETESGDLVLTIPPGEERYFLLVIEWVIDSSAPAYFELGWKENPSDASDYPQGKPPRACWFFPPVTPPKPPRIASVIPMTIAGDEPPTPPFPATPGLISVREGQQFKCNVEIFGDEDVRAAPVTLSVDGHAIECGSGTLIDDSANNRWFRQFVAVLPTGCGEGKLTAKLGLSTSEPFYIDVANKGLIAYLYDLPNPSGYSQFPNILPLTCHTIRKEREINFGTADSFNLPFVAETLAVEWYGAIIIEQDGWYTFTSRTDDGCRVWLNGIEIIDDDNLHAPQEKSSERIRLVAGTYPFRMQFFENNMHEECLLFVSAVDLQEKELLSRQVVPKRMFTWEVHDQLPQKVATGKRADGSE